MPAVTRPLQSNPKCEVNLNILIALSSQEKKKHIKMYTPRTHKDKNHKILSKNISLTLQLSKF